MGWGGAVLLEATLLVVAILIGCGAAFRGYGLAQRLLVTRGIPEGSIVRQQRGITVRVFLTGTPARTGFDPRKRNRTKGDLVLTGDRLVLATNRGVLVDVHPGRERGFTSVRCTGPQRLVIEGDVPRPDGKRGFYRYELVVDDAQGWADALQPYVVEGEEAARFASFRSPS